MVCGWCCYGSVACGFNSTKRRAEHGRLVSHSTLTFAVGYNTPEGKRIIAGGPATMGPSPLTIKGFSPAPSRSLRYVRAITDGDITSVPAPGDGYRSGENIDVTLTLDVVVDGSRCCGDPWLRRRRPSHPREARYVEGSGTDILVFGSTV